MMPGMGTRKGIVILIVLAVAAAGFWFIYFLRPREPVYQGKRLTAWLEQYDTSYMAGQGGGDVGQQAEAAIRNIGTNALPLCLQLVKTKESPIKVKLLTLVPGPWLDGFHVPGLAEYRNEINRRREVGAHGFFVLGKQAKAAVPALIGLMSDKDHETRSVAVRTLGGLGPAASGAVPELIEYLKDPDDTIRAEAAESLGVIHQEPERVVPLLMGMLLEKPRPGLPHWFVTFSAIGSLGSFGVQARPAVPLLVGLLSDPDPGIGSAATNALRQIDPEALAKAGVQ
jgi:HEAT repeats